MDGRTYSPTAALARYAPRGSSESTGRQGIADDSFSSFVLPATLAGPACWPPARPPWRARATTTPRPTRSSRPRSAAGERSRSATSPAPTRHGSPSAPTPARHAHARGRREAPGRRRRPSRARCTRRATGSTSSCQRRRAGNPGGNVTITSPQGAGAVTSSGGTGITAVVLQRSNGGPYRSRQLHHHLHVHGATPCPTTRRSPRGASGVTSTARTAVKQGQTATTGRRRTPRRLQCDAEADFLFEQCNQ